jgi:hypothetical protein
MGRHHAIVAWLVMMTAHIQKVFGRYRYVCECGRRGRRTYTFWAACMQWIAHVNGKHKGGGQLWFENTID